MFDPDEKQTGAAPEVADPEVTETPTAAVAPREAPVESKETPPAAGESETTAAAGQKGRQDPETNAKFAKLRRETDEIRTQLKARDSWVEQKFGSQGIHTWEQYRAAVDAQQNAQTQAQVAQAVESRKKRAEELRNVGIEPDIIDDLIKSHPEVQSLVRANAQLKQKADDEALVKQFEELSTGFPHIKEPSDIDADTWRKFQGSQGNLTLFDAYVSVHSKDILATARGAGEQDAVAKLAGKQHLQTEKSVGKAGEEIEVHLTNEQLETWAVFGYDEKAARARERKRIKERGGK